MHERRLQKLEYRSDRSSRRKHRDNREVGLEEITVENFTELK